MYRFQYVSDLHLEFRKKVLRIPPVAPFLLLAGDIGYPCRSLYREFLRYAAHDFEKVFLVAGNHEFYQGAKQGKNLRWFHPLSMTSILDKNMIMSISSTIPFMIFHTSVLSDLRFGAILIRKLLSFTTNSRSTKRERRL